MQAMATTTLAIKKNREFNPSTFLATIGEGRKLGFVDYSCGPEGGLQVHSSLLGVVLHDYLLSRHNFALITRT